MSRLTTKRRRARRWRRLAVEGRIRRNNEIPEMKWARARLAILCAVRVAELEVFGPRGLH